MNLRFLRPNPINTAGSLFGMILLNSLLHDSESILKVFNLGIVIFGYSLSGMVFQFIWLYILISVTYNYIKNHFVAVRDTNPTKITNIWIESIKYNILPIIIMLIILFTTELRFPIFLYFFSAPLFGMLFCYLSLSEYNSALRYSYRFMPLIGLVVSIFIIATFFKNLGLAGPAVFLIVFSPFVYIYLVTEVFHFWNKKKM